MRTPDDVLTEIRTVRAQLMKASDAIAKAKLAADRTDLAADLEFDKAFMTAEGSIPERQAVGRSSSTEVRDVAFIASSELERVQKKTRHLEAALTSLQTELKWMRGEGA
jgi:hypothetical protein